MYAGQTQLSAKAITPPVFVEACCDNVSNSVAAQKAGAHRIELCGGGDGGTTPSLGAIEVAFATLRVPLAVMIRPRAGNFVYDTAEIRVMIRDIELARAAGVSRVVVGVLRDDSTIDVEQMRALISAAGTLPVTFHRAFDHTPDAAAALELLVELGVDTVLTSGQAATAEEGALTLRALAEQAGERIQILAGGGVRAQNIVAIVEQSSVRNVHLRGTDACVVEALVEASHGSHRGFHSPRATAGTKLSIDLGG